MFFFHNGEHEEARREMLAAKGNTMSCIKNLDGFFSFLPASVRSITHFLLPVTLHDVYT